MCVRAGKDECTAQRAHPSDPDRDRTVRLTVARSPRDAHGRATPRRLRYAPRGCSRYFLEAGASNTSVTWKRHCARLSLACAWLRRWLKPAAARFRRSPAGRRLPLPLNVSAWGQPYPLRRRLMNRPTRSTPSSKPVAPVSGTDSVTAALNTPVVQTVSNTSCPPSVRTGVR